MFPGYEQAIFFHRDIPSTSTALKQLTILNVKIGELHNVSVVYLHETKCLPKWIIEFGAFLT